MFQSPLISCSWTSFPGDSVLPPSVLDHWTTQQSSYAVGTALILVIALYSRQHGLNSNADCDDGNEDINSASVADTNNGRHQCDDSELKHHSHSDSNGNNMGMRSALLVGGLVKTQECKPTIIQLEDKSVWILDMAPNGNATLKAAWITIHTTLRVHSSLRSTTTP